MKLTKTTEWIVIGALIVYIAFTPGFQVMRDMLATPVGRVVGLAAIVYVWKYVSALIAVLLAVAFVRCAGMPSIWERFEEKAAATCTCEDGFSFDSVTKMCKNSAGAIVPPVACTCPTGYSYDATTKECTQTSSMSGPLPVPEPEPNATSTPAPAQSTAPMTGTAPMTTPGEAQAMASTAPPPPPMTTGPAAKESFTGYPFA
jgi:hypothetical protein